MLHWLDIHAGAVTGISTLILALITAIYVVLTYRIPREQRRQALEPRVSREMQPADGGGVNLRVRNLGPGIATDVVLKAGPSTSLPSDVHMDNLGTAADLGVREDRLWTFEWKKRNGKGDISLMLSYLDRDLKRIWFNVFMVRFTSDDAGISAGWSSSFTARRLKRVVRRKLPIDQRVVYLLRHLFRGQLHVLMVDTVTLQMLSKELDRRLLEALEWEKRYIQGMTGA